MTSLPAFLLSEYPQLRSYMGDVAFGQLVQAYARHALGRRLGPRHAAARLPAFMARQEALARKPEVVDLARLELAQNTAFAAPDIPPLTAEALLRLAQNASPITGVTLHPSASLLRFGTNAISLAAALRCGEQPPLPSRLDEVQAVLVWRQGDAARCRVLGRAEERAVAQLKRGMSAAALVPSGGLPASTQAPVHAFLTGWIEAGLLVFKTARAAEAAPHSLSLED